MSQSQLEQIASILSILQALATVAAFALGGIWTLWVFNTRRQRYPRASIEHLVTHKRLGHSKVLLHVDVRISNIGEVLMSVLCSETRIQQVLPVLNGLADSIKQARNPVRAGETEVEWPLIDSHLKEYGRGDCEIEPGEGHDINHDFIFKSDIQTVVIYSYVTNEKKRDRTLAWNLTTLYDLADPASTHSLIPGG
jgi:hypothetical protein